MAYYMALPVLYFGSQFAATRAMHAASDWFADCVPLHDQSAVVLTAAQSILKAYHTMAYTHPAFTTKNHLERLVHTLVYTASKARGRNQRWQQQWRLLRTDFAVVNQQLHSCIQETEQCIRMFREVVQLVGLTPGATRAKV
jgi:hypothetical protein